MHRRAAVLLLVASLLGVPRPLAATGPPQPRPGALHAAPLHGELLRVYDAPDDPYAPGHRGVDVGAPAGSPVYASANGVVSFAGSVAGNRSVTIDHPDGTRTTYSYLQTIVLTSNNVVSRGNVIGTVGAGHPNSGLPPHVHLSARRNGLYFDPLTLYVGETYSDLLALEG